MADVATLGLAVDSSQVKSATSDLNKLTAASNSAEQAQQRIKTASGQVGVTFKTVQQMADRAGVSFDEMKKGIEANMAAQGKMGEASAPAVKGMQQLSEQAGKTSKDHEELSKKTNQTTSSMEKLASRFTKGLIVGAALAGIRELIHYLTQLNSQLAATYQTAGRSGIGTDQFQGLQTAAAFKGVGNQDFNSAMLSFNQQVGLAKNGLGVLQVLLRSNGQTVGSSAATFGKIADLVQRASGDYAKQVSILQQAGLPATQQWVSLMEQGSAAINKQVDASAKVTAQQLENQKRINDGWNEIVASFQNSMKEFVVSASEFPQAGSPLADFLGMVRGQKKWSITLDLSPEPGSTLDWLIKNWVKLGVKAGIVTPTPDLVANPANPTPVVTRDSDLAPAKAAPRVFDPALARQQIALEQQRIGILGPLATVEDQVRSKQLEINAAALNNVGISKSQAAALLDITRAQAEMARAQQQAQIGVFNLGISQKAANDNLKAMVDQKLLDPNNPAQYAAATTAAAKSIENLANQAKVAGAPLEQLQRLANDAGSARTQLDQLSTTTLNSMSDNLVAIASGSVRASDGIKNFANSFVQALEKMIIQMMIIKPIADALQTSLGGLGFLGLGGPGIGATSATAGASSFMMGGQSFPMFAAAGGGTFGPGWGVVGEHGPELINVHKNGGVTIVPNHVSKPYLPGFAEGGTLFSNGNVVRGPWGQNNTPVINIINQTSGKVEQGGTRRNADGSIDVFIRDAVRGVMLDDAAKNGDISKAMSARVSGFNGR